MTMRSFFFLFFFFLLFLSSSSFSSSSCSSSSSSSSSNSFFSSSFYPPSPCPSPSSSFFYHIFPDVLIPLGFHVLFGSTFLFTRPFFLFNCYPILSSSQTQSSSLPFVSYFFSPSWCSCNSHSVSKSLPMKFMSLACTLVTFTSETLLYINAPHLCISHVFSRSASYIHFCPIK